MATTSLLFTRNAQGDRRLTAGTYRLVLTAHIATAVGWLGVAFAKLVLGLVAIRTGDPAIATGLYAAMSALSIAFPPVAVGTVVTGVLLSLGTRWGLLDHYWVATKLTLTVGVIATSVRMAESAIQGSAAWAREGGPTTGIALEPAVLIALSFAHLLMLGVATVLSTYKPWGKAQLGRRAADSVKSLTLRLTRLG